MHGAILNFLLFIICSVSVRFEEKKRKKRKKVVAGAAHYITKWNQ